LDSFTPAICVVDYVRDFDGKLEQAFGGLYSDFNDTVAVLEKQNLLIDGDSLRFDRNCTNLGRGKLVFNSLDEFGSISWYIVLCFGSVGVLRTVLAVFRISNLFGLSIICRNAHLVHDLQ
jgi:hypothetical protein